MFRLNWPTKILGLPLKFICEPGFDLYASKGFFLKSSFLKTYYSVKKMAVYYMTFYVMIMKICKADRKKSKKW